MDQTALMEMPGHFKLGIKRFLKPLSAHWETIPQWKGKIIIKEELNKKMINNDSIQIVNVLTVDQYGLGSVRGSLKIPLPTLEERADELDASKEIITYSASSECSGSKIAADILTAKGFKARAYVGGIIDWRNAGLPTEKEESV